MQSISEAYNCLECADCKSSFACASLLLKHFAHHISEKDNKGEYEYQKCGPSVMAKAKKKKSILETVLKRSAMRQWQSHDSSSTSVSSQESFNLDNKDSNVDELITEQTIISEIGQRAKEKSKLEESELSLVKFDLQKRLENCVSKLTSKQDQPNNSEESAILQLSALGTSVHRVLPAEESQPETSNTGSEMEDMNSENLLNFCMGALKHSANYFNSNDEKSTYNHILQGQVFKSGRKQQMPKKILYHTARESSPSGSVVDMEGSMSVPLCEDNAEKVKRRYPCHLCSKVFGWSTDLKRHILTHTGERPFKCQTCDATFTRNFLLQKHEVRIHQKVPKVQHQSIDLGASFTLKEEESSVAESCRDEKVSSKKRKMLCNSMTSGMVPHTALSVSQA